MGTIDVLMALLVLRGIIINRNFKNLSPGYRTIDTQVKIHQRLQNQSIYFVRCNTSKVICAGNFPS